MTFTFDLTSGLKETNVINLSLKTNEIYIEKFGSSIIYRSR